MNVWERLLFLSAIIYLGFGLYTLRLNSRGTLNRVFFIQAISLGIWALGLSFMVSAPSSAGALVWLKVSLAACFFFFAISMHFFLLLVGRTKLLAYRWFFLLLYGPALFFIFYGLSPLGGITADSFYYTRWGGWVARPPSQEPWFWAYTLYYTSFLAVNLCLLYRWGATAEDHNLRGQARLIIGVISVTLVLGSLSDILLPALGFPVPQMAIVLILLWVFGVGYSMTKYRLMTVYPAVAAEDILKTMTDLVMLVSPEGIISTANQAMFDLLGYQESDVIDHPIGQFVREEDFTTILLRGSSVSNVEMTLLTRDKGEIPVLFSRSVCNDNLGKMLGYVCVFHDISDRKQVERKLEQQKLYFEALFKNSTDGIVLYDREQRIISVNPRFVELFGPFPDDVNGSYLREVVAAEDYGEGEVNTENVLQGEHYALETIRFNRLGEPIEVSIKGVPVIVDEKVVGGYELYADISERKRHEEQLIHAGFHDGLTGIYNRKYFEEELKRLDSAREYPVSIIMTDVDNLKFINDSQGHALGDKLLKDCTQVLSKSVRKHDILARIGGDEFAILLPRTDTGAAEQIRNRIVANLHEYNRENPKTTISLSLGLATATCEEGSVFAAFRNADVRMYQDKFARKGGARKLSGGS